MRGPSDTAVEMSTGCLEVRRGQWHRDGSESHATGKRSRGRQVSGEERSSRTCCSVEAADVQKAARRAEPAHRVEGQEGVGRCGLAKCTVWKGVSRRKEGTRDCEGTGQFDNSTSEFKNNSKRDVSAAAKMSKAGRWGRGAREAPTGRLTSLLPSPPTCPPLFHSLRTIAAHSTDGGDPGGKSCSRTKTQPGKARGAAWSHSGGLT